MNKEEIKNVLVEEGLKQYNEDDYFIIQAMIFADSYIKYFSDKKILSLMNFSSVIMNFRLPVKNLFKDENGKVYDFTDKYILYLEDMPCLEFNSKRQVTYIWTDGKKEKIGYKTDVLSYINSFYDSDREELLEELAKYQEQCIFLSCFYQYVLILLKEKEYNEIDSVRIGAFKNAYFDILNYVPYDLYALKRL